MTDTLTLLQFKSPRQGRSGFARYHMDEASGAMTPAKDAKSKKLLRKGQKGIDGLVLFPTWATRKGLVVTAGTDDLRLTEICRGRPDLTSAPIHTSDAAFQSGVAERLLYRNFTFSDGSTTMSFSDLSARLVSAERTAFEVFPTPDFSPFARLARILTNPAAHAKLVNDLNKGRFDYPCWSDHARKTWQGRAALTAEG